MSTVRKTIDPRDPASLSDGQIEPAIVDATTEAQIASQQQEDDAEAIREVARYVRQIRKRLALSQVEFARRMNVPRQTIHDWEQGKRVPTGAARALLRVLDKAPEAALRVLT